MVISFLKIVPLSEKREAVFEILRSVMDLTRGRAGCLGCASYEEHSEQHPVLYVELWESKEDLHRHIQSSLYNRILIAMDFASQAPEISFHEVSKTTGMDMIEGLRTAGEPAGVMH